MAFTSTPSTPVPELTLGLPMTTVTFANGTALEMYHVGDAQLKLGTLVTPSGFSGSSSSRGGGIGGNGLALNYHIQEANGTLIGTEWTSPPGNLLISCRLLDTKGQSWSPGLFPWDGSLKGPDSRYQDAPSWETMTEEKTHRAGLPEIMVQLSDGAGGWINGGGPASRDDSDLDLTVLAFQAWPRSQATFKFRAVIPGQPIVSWTLPNPLHPAIPATWKPDTLPKTITEPNFELVFLEAYSDENLKGAVAPRDRFRSKIASDEGLSPNHQSIAAECVEVQGALGTRSAASIFPLETQYYKSGFRLPPGESLLRFRYKVTATDYYRYPREGAVELITGTVAADGKSIHLEPSQLSKFGLKSATVTALPRNEGWHWKIRFEWTSERAKARAEKALHLDEQTPVCFINDSTESVGHADIDSRSSGYANQESHLQFDVKWAGTPSMARNDDSTRYFLALPKPGTKITLGMVKPKPDREYDFVTPRPE